MNRLSTWPVLTLITASFNSTKADVPSLYGYVNGLIQFTRISESGTVTSFPYYPPLTAITAKTPIGKSRVRCRRSFRPRWPDRGRWLRTAWKRHFVRLHLRCRLEDREEYRGAR